MKNKWIASILLLLCYTTQGQKISTQNGPEVITGKLLRITKPLRDFTLSDDIPFVKVRNREGIIGMKEEGEESGDMRKNKRSYRGFTGDPALQKNYPNRLPQNASRAIVQNFDGLPDVGASPADPTLCVGPNHIIQMVNGVSGAILQVFDKFGNVVLPSKNLDAITGNGGGGDPIALYDQLADRFILTELVNAAETGSQGLSIAVSQTPDPTGAWFVYFFSTGTSFPDYPKFSVWNNAYYATSHDFTNRTQFIGCSVYAFDRTKILAGDPSATVQKFLIGGGAAQRELSMCPVLLQGAAVPPAGTGGLIAYMNDNNWSGSLTDSIGLFEFNANFTNPALSTLTTKASLAVNPYVPFVGFNFGQAATQPGSGLNLDVIQERVMNQPVYRNFGDHEGIVLTHVADIGGQISGVRWYELQKTTGNWSVINQSTYGPDNTFRFVPSIAYDAAGNIGLAYNVSSGANSVFPGARYTGRSSCDPANTMSFAENDLIVGTGINGGNRWGDYNHMVCDPDGLRFWFTCAYNTSLVWSTRIASFTLDNCSAALCGDPSSLTATGVTGSTAVVAWAAVPNAVSYDVDLQLSGTGSWTRMATAITTASFNFTGLGPNLNWLWRVRANCTAGPGNFVSGQFTTIAPCSLPTDLFSFDETNNSASVSWIPGLTFVSFDVEYKLNSSATWISAGNTSTTFVNITGLAANSLYNWRVRTVCSNGSSAFVEGQFTTLAAAACPGIYDISANGNFAAAQLVPLNTDIKGKISNREDDDFYKFVIPVAGNIAVSLTTLPANYDIRLYNGSRSQLAISEKRGFANELINRRLSAGTYYLKVYGKDGAFNIADCYTVKISSGAGIAAPELATANPQPIIYPNPANNTLNVWVNANNKPLIMRVADAQGKLLIAKTSSQVNTAIDISKLATGVYFVTVSEAGGNNIFQSKFVKQ